MDGIITKIKGGALVHANVMLILIVLLLSLPASQSIANSGSNSVNDGRAKPSSPITLYLRRNSIDDKNDITDQSTERHTVSESAVNEKNPRRKKYTHTGTGASTTSASSGTSSSGCETTSTYVTDCTDTTSTKTSTGTSISKPRSSNTATTFGRSTSNTDTISSICISNSPTTIPTASPSVPVPVRQPPTVPPSVETETEIVSSDAPSVSPSGPSYAPTESSIGTRAPTRIIIADDGFRDDDVLVAGPL